MSGRQGVFPRTVEEVRQQVRLLREALGLSQKQVHLLSLQGPELYHISESAVSSFERRENELRLQKFLNIVHAMAVTPLDVFPADSTHLPPQSAAHRFLHEAVDRLSQKEAEGLVPFVEQPPAGWRLVTQPDDPPVQLPRLETILELHVGQLIEGGDQTYRVVGLDTGGRQQLHPMSDRALRRLIFLTQQLASLHLGVGQGPSLAPSTP